jgi:hypothetical protein
MQSPQAKLKDITRLLASWPSAAGEGEEQLRGYLLAVDDYAAGDVRAAVDALIKGEAPGVNPNFLPPAAVVGGECRRQMNLRLRREELAQRPRLSLPKPLAPPDTPPTPESEARVRELVAETVASLRRVAEAVNGDQAKRKADGWARTNARFMPEMEDAEMERRLGFTVGDRDSDAA